MASEPQTDPATLQGRHDQNKSFNANWIWREVVAGPTRPGVDPGKPFPADPLPEVNSPLEVTVNGRPAEILLSIGRPGTVDRYRVDIRVPEGTAAGPATIHLSTAWIAGPDVTIAIQ